MTFLIQWGLSSKAGFIVWFGLTSSSGFSPLKRASVPCGSNPHPRTRSPLRAKEAVKDVAVPRLTTSLLQLKITIIRRN